jgi:hypothetical protein
MVLPVSNRVPPYLTNMLSTSTADIRTLFDKVTSRYLYSIWRLPHNRDFYYLSWIYITPKLPLPLAKLTIEHSFQYRASKSSRNRCARAGH